jgi:hypothetical protein
MYLPSPWQEEQGLVDFELMIGENGAAKSKAPSTTSTSLEIICMKRNIKHFSK